MTSAMSEAVLEVLLEQRPQKLGLGRRVHIHMQRRQSAPLARAPLSSSDQPPLLPAFPQHNLLEKPDLLEKP